MLSNNGVGGTEKWEILGTRTIFEMLFCQRWSMDLRIISKAKICSMQMMSTLFYSLCLSLSVSATSKRVYAHQLFISNYSRCFMLYPPILGETPRLNVYIYKAKERWNRMAWLDLVWFGMCITYCVGRKWETIQSSNMVLGLKKLRQITFIVLIISKAKFAR